MANTSVSARFGAVSLLHSVLLDHVMLSDAVDRIDGPLSKLAPADRARAQSLAALTLRYMPQLDSVLDELLQKPPPLKARNAMRVCAAEVLVDGIAAHGAVNAAVEIVQSARKTAHLGGMANAVGRKISKMDPSVLADLPTPMLPKSIRGAILKSFGEEAALAIENAHLNRPPVDITVKTPQNADKWAQVLNADVLPNGSLRLERPGQISALPGFEQGAWWVQDAAAATPARLLGDLQGLKVLDLCAAPGGKTLQLLSAGAEVTALDISAGRMERVRENAERIGLSPICVVADAMSWDPGVQFDVVLLDAPCSATGTIRRHPDLPYVRPNIDLKPLLELQQKLLARSFGWLKPNGRLVYATCSLIPAEGERQIERFFETDPAAEMVAFDPANFGFDTNWQNTSGTLRLRPDYWAGIGGMDGFFMAVLRNTQK